AYCLKTQPATGETYPKSDLFNKAASSLKNWLSPHYAVVRSSRASCHPYPDGIAGSVRGVQQSELGSPLV
ncbi:hypothetical protein, partial [Klebsiella pneumoniae]|uniref:hypothetical protein n=1 Tax=Klebsiella pneumoniae TaxID=573 RepID=UPI001CA31BAC